jgi:hypothetical protein
MEAIVFWFAVISGSAAVSFVCLWFIRSIFLASICTAITVDLFCVLGDTIWRGYLDGWWFIAMWTLGAAVFATSLTVGLIMKYTGLLERLRGS